MMLEKVLWLFNFSASFTGGGLMRLIETARWFDQNEGGNFIVNEKAFHAVKNFSKKNVFFFSITQQIKKII